MNIVVVIKIMTNLVSIDEMSSLANDRSRHPPRNDLRQPLKIRVVVFDEKCPPIEVTITAFLS